MAETMKNPFVGLRPFRKEESHLFFGREEQVDDILEKLFANRFASILGNSGAGKSSFVYCSLLPKLESGLKVNGQSIWKCYNMYPGTINPFENLVSATKAGQSEHSVDTKNIKSEDFDSLVNLLIPKDNENANILLFVDQFEELFRVHDASKILHFLEFILHAVNREDIPVYVLITIRSDLVGYCSEYPSFTKKMNKGQYLLPRMTSDQKRRAIIKPIELMGVEISDSLVDRLLADEHSETDQLPVLQHALMRTWEYWKQTGGSRPIGVWEYEAVGTMKKALSVHANEVFSELNEEEQIFTERLFRTIGTNKDGFEVRNPERIELLAEITNCTDLNIIYNIVNAFRAEGRSFLVPQPHVELEKTAVIDISHESLIRIWDLMRIWLEKEQEAVKQYVRLADRALLYREGKVSRLSGAELQLLLSWRREENPTKEWAVRHHPDYEAAMLFLDYCEKKEISENKRKSILQKGKIRVQRVLIIIFFLIGIIGALLAVYAMHKKELAHHAKIDAERSADTARIEKERALEQQKIAEKNAKEALEANKRAKKQQMIALGEAFRANQAKKEADEQRVVAVENLVVAKKATKEAIVAKNDAEQQRERAEEERKKAEILYFQAESKTLAGRSISILNEGDKQTATILALHSFYINKENEGPNQVEPIYQALNKCLRANKVTNDIPKIHSQGVTSISYNKSKNVFATTGNDGQIKIWKMTDNDSSKVNLQATLPPHRRISGLRFIQGTSKFIASSGNKLFLFDNSGENPVEQTSFETKLTSEIKKMAINKTDSSVYLSLHDGKALQIIELKGKTTREIAAIETPESYCFANRYLGEKMWLCFGNENNRLTIVNQNLKHPSFRDTVDVINIGKKITSLAFSHDGSILAIGTSKGAIEIRETRNFTKQHELLGHKGYVTDLKFNPTNPNQLASVSLDKSVRLWIYNSSKGDESIKLETELWSNEVEFTPDGKHLISVGEDRTLRLWPTNAQTLAEQLCKYATRMTKSELNEYIEKEFNYKEKNCVSFE